MARKLGSEREGSSTSVERLLAVGSFPARERARWRGPLPRRLRWARWVWPGNPCLTRDYRVEVRSRVRSRNRRILSNGRLVEDLRDIHASS